MMRLSIYRRCGMNKIFSLAVLLLCGNMLISCGLSDRKQNQFSADGEWMEKLSDFNDSHQQRMETSPSVQIENFEYPYKKREIGFSWDELENLTEVKEGKWKLSKDEALEDTNLLEKCFKYLYPGYQLYGGDRTFLKAFTEIRKEIDQSDRVNQDELVALYRKHLGFVKDGHIYFNNQPLYEGNYIFYSDQCYYRD